MDITLNRLEGNAATLVVTVSAQAVDAAIAEAYRTAAADRSFPGFRKGKAPRSVLDTHIGRMNILAEAANVLAQEYCAQAIAEEELLLISEPGIMLTGVVAEGEPYTFTAKLELRPELSLSGHDDLIVHVPPKEVTDAEVVGALEQFQESLGTFDVASSKPVAARDMVIMSLTSEIEGVEGSQMSVSVQPYELGRGGMPPAFDEGLIGHTAGDEVHIEIALPDSVAAEEQDKKLIFDVTLHEVRSKNVPELTDATAAMFGYADLAALHDEFHERLQAERDRLYERTKRLGARRELAAHLEGEIPDIMINTRLSETLQAFSQDLTRNNVSFEQYCQQNRIQPEQFFDVMKRSVEQEIREELALEALFRARGLVLDDERREGLFAELAEATGASIEQQHESWEGPLRAEMRRALETRLAMDWLLDNVIFKTQDTSTAEESAAETADAEANTAETADA